MSDELESLQTDHEVETASAKQIKFALEEKWNDEDASGKGDEGMTEEAMQDQTTQEEAVETPAANNEELEQLARERDEYLEHLKRLQAEFDNFRKRTQREREELSAYMLQDFMAKLLPVADTFQRAMETASDSGDIESYRQGVEMVHKQFMNILKENGLEKIETVGQLFDPNLHEAVSQTETADQEPGTIVSEFSPGYILKERVIQAPKVVVAIAPKQEESSTEANNAE